MHEAWIKRWLWFTGFCFDLHRDWLEKRLGNEFATRLGGNSGLKNLTLLKGPWWCAVGCRMENNSRLEEPEFRLLAAVYAALGKDAVGASIIVTCLDWSSPAQRSMWKYCQALWSRSYFQRHIVFPGTPYNPCSQGTQDKYTLLSRWSGGSSSPNKYASRA